MPGMDLADPGWTITLHDRPLLKAHKQLPRRRDQSQQSIDLRAHYKRAPGQVANGNLNHAPEEVSTTPPNPPEAISLDAFTSINAVEPSEHGRDDSSNAETTILRSRVATPTYQKSPPTPDITPPRPEVLLRPRPFLATVPSISSRAESFKTAREELSSDEEPDDRSPSQRPSRQRWLQSIKAGHMPDWNIRPSPLAQTAANFVTPTKSIRRKPLPTEAFATFDGSWDARDADQQTPTTTAPSLNGTVGSVEKGESLRTVASHPSPLPTPPHSADAEEPPAAPEPSEPPLQRGKSLRDRLEEAKMVRTSDSTENFARDIGWSHIYKAPDLQNRINSWRLSGISTTSTVEAIVVDADVSPRRQQQLRHSRKNPSLRSTSSPFPASNRTSLLSNPESPHRLIHKKGQITNKNRWSMDSEASKMLTSSPIVYHRPEPEPEIIRVAVIPERKSSLQSSENSSRRHSVSLSTSSADHQPIQAPYNAPAEPHVPLRKKRAMSASLFTEVLHDSRGRHQQSPPVAPPRPSSLSAPTSRSPSRANSLTSEHFRLRRLAAEEDLHRTLERMESERSVIPRYSASHSRKDSSTHGTESASDNWDTLRPPSQYTPFSLPSMDSPSPGPVEMGEARAVNLFPHNNHSLQIIDQFPLPESRAVEFLQKSGGKGRLSADEPSTPTQTTLPKLQIDSPLRNPRDPPQPPALKVIPPTPADMTPVENNDWQLGMPAPGASRKAGSLSRRFGSLKRPMLGNRNRSESFVISLSRALSLKSARNMKADQQLDANLHPFWRPRGFWDDITDSETDEDDYGDDIIVRNSLGVPQKRTIIDGPISLVRYLSDNSRRQRRTHGVSKTPSHGSLPRSRRANRTDKFGLGRQFPLARLRDFQDRFLVSKRQKENERREKSRQALREKIGPQVISTGDSRYPAMIPSATPRAKPQQGLTY
jgi:hypothetical protein